MVPWGWSAASGVGRAERLALRWPDLGVVARQTLASSHRALEREWNVGLPERRGRSAACRITRRGRRVDAARCRAWVVKANFGMSARERILGRGTPPSPQAVQWVQKQLAENGAVYFEPWVDRIEEVGVQFTVPKEGEPLLEGITPLLTDQLGTYRGSRFRGISCQLARSDEFAPVLDVVTRAVQRIQQLGYFGPLGIDAMRYRTAEGEIRWRPLQDINARLTMGRLALGLRRIVPESQHASWLHLRPIQGKYRKRRIHPRRIEPPFAGARIVRTSPMIVGGQPAAGFHFSAQPRRPKRSTPSRHFA